MKVGAALFLALFVPFGLFILAGLLLRRMYRLRTPALGLVR